MPYLNVFDSKGQFSFAECSEAAVATLSAPQQEALSLLIDAHSHRQAAAEKLAIAQREARDAMNDEAQKHQAYVASVPPTSRLDALRASILAYNGLPAETPSGSHPKKAILRPRVEHERAVAVLAEKRSALEVAKAALTSTDRQLSEAALNWINHNPAPDALSVTREHLARGDAERAARFARGEPATPPKAQPRHASALDQQASARGRSGTRTSLQSNVVRRTV